YEYIKRLPNQRLSGDDGIVSGINPSFHCDRLIELYLLDYHGENEYILSHQGVCFAGVHAYRSGVIQYPWTSPSPLVRAALLNAWFHEVCKGETTVTPYPVDVRFVRCDKHDGGDAQCLLGYGHPGDHHVNLFGAWPVPPRRINKKKRSRFGASLAPRFVR